MVLPAGAGKAGGHYHLDFDQHFDVIAGTATMTVEGEAADGHAVRVGHLRRPTRHADPCTWGRSADAQLLLIANETDSQSSGAGPPRAIQNPIAPIVAAIARLRRYRAPG